jgi:DMSO reductase anchor subunit
MQPAYSIILFTVASGAGFGLLAWLALFGLIGAVPADRALAVIGFGLAWVLVTVGLVASLLHLGRPERAWRALSQWRTSWLSREGVLALASLSASGLLAVGWVFTPQIDGVLIALAAVMTIASSLATLCATGMIYASLPTIRQWHQPLTMPIYLALGLASGAVLLNLVLAIRGLAAPALTTLCIALLAAGAGLKWAYWMRIDGAPRTLRAAAAIGLGHGKLSALEAPHTQPNFVMREMGFAVARRHAAALRKIALTLAFAVPLVALLATYRAGPVATLGATLLAALATGAGLLVERWLFFAEAEHVAMLYYGRDAA